jgi:heme-binding NEAT domain protein
MTVWHQKVKNKLQKYVWHVQLWSEQENLPFHCMVPQMPVKGTVGALTYWIKYKVTKKDTNYKQMWNEQMSKCETLWHCDTKKLKTNCKNMSDTSNCGVNKMWHIDTMWHRKSSFSLHVPSNAGQRHSRGTYLFNFKLQKKDTNNKQMSRHVDIYLSTLTGNRTPSHFTLQHLGGGPSTTAIKRL